MSLTVNGLSRSKDAKADRLIELDGLRGLAALGVALFHLKIFLAGAANPLSLLPGGEWLMLKGWHLVDLFFVLSGFIFAHCYLQDGQMREGVGLSKFAWARVARLYPLHIALLCFTAFMLRHDADTTWSNFVMSLMMLHIFLPDIEVLNPPVWSISVECLCYALFAILAVRTGPRRFQAASLAVAAAGAWLILSEASPYIGRGFFGFFIGCLVQQNREHLSRIPWPVMVAAAALPFVVGNAREWIVLESLVSWPAALLLAPKLAALRTRPLQWLGSRSYAIYLSHVPLFIFFGNLVLAYPGIPINIAVLVCLAMVLLVSDILYRRLELPMQAKLLDARFASGVSLKESR